MDKQNRQRGSERTGPTRDELLLGLLRTLPQPRPKRTRADKRKKKVAIKKQDGR